MILVKLIGGLGNQMFQYAAGRALSVKYQCPLYLDLSFLNAETNNAYTKRNYELDQLRITSGIATPDMLAPFQKKTGLLERFLKPANALTVVNENGSSFNPDFTKIKPPAYLNGFWQSEKYFHQIREIIYNEFLPAYEFSSEEKTIIEEIKACNAVSVHVRRGDYVHLKSASEYHGTCSMGYYNAAIERISSKIKSPTFFIFSDDMAWCRDNFKHVHGARFVEGKKRHSGFDLYLMSQCLHHIIANSSYSWWGAWLNRSAEKIVIAPKNWFASSVAKNEDLLPSGYITL